MKLNDNHRPNEKSTWPLENPWPALNLKQNKKELNKHLREWNVDYPYLTYPDAKLKSYFPVPVNSDAHLIIKNAYKLSQSIESSYWLG